MSQESPKQPDSVTSPSVSSQVETGKAHSPEKENLSFPKKQVFGVWRGIINLLKTTAGKLGTTAAQEKRPILDDSATTTSVAKVIDADVESEEEVTTIPEVSDSKASESDTTATITEAEEVIDTEFSELEKTIPEITDTPAPELETTTPKVIDSTTPVSPTATSEITDTDFVELETTTPEVSDTPTPELETTQTVIQQTPNPVEKRSEETAEVFSQPKTLGLMDRILPTFPKLQTWWDLVLDKIRSFLPVAVSEKLNDLALTGILTGLVVAILWISVALLPEPKTKVVELPPSVAAPSQLQAPQKPKLVETLIPPPPRLTPEQSLIAAIQKQVGEFTNNYAEGLITSIQANFTIGGLTVQVGDDWYQLASEKQDSLAEEILLRAQELDFAKLEIHDSQGTMVARNPVVGKRMVILLRQKL